MIGLVYLIFIFHINKIHLIEPSIKNPEKYDPTKPIRISKTKSIEWDIELAPCKLITIQ